jgi:apolipoprotein D and lipocalin family protein
MYCRAILAAIALLMFAGCSSVPRPPVPLVAEVDLDRFMGDWYVIASIPTYIERDAWNAVESYHLDDDGSIATTFTFRKGGFDGPEKRYTPRGFVFDRSSNAVWGMQFVWPIKADYRIAYLSEDYGQTVIAR